jgi:hypothetical protein
MSGQSGAGLRICDGGAVMGLFDMFYDIPDNNLQGQRALTVEEIHQIQIAQLRDMRNCQNPYNNLANFTSYVLQVEEPNLDERFADFKTRLAAAIHRTEQAKLTGTANQVHMGTIK